METTNKQTNLRQKLAEIRKSFTTFAITDDSDKKGPDGKPAYRYTPGWAIVEAIKAKMDEVGVMLEPTLHSESHEMITYPVYKEIDHKIVPFQKKEMYVSLVMAYTFVDVATGETVGPFLQPSAGANGTDKSIASALSLAERYFLLKYFQFTTREKTDEPDAHDSDDIPGRLAKDYPAAQTYNRGAGLMPQGPYYAASPASQGAPATQADGGPYVAPQKTQPAAMPQPQAAPEQPQNLYEQAAMALMRFQAGSKTHNEILQQVMIDLNKAGYNTADPGFAQQLVRYAQEKREQRAAQPAPAYPTLM